MLRFFLSRIPLIFAAALIVGVGGVVAYQFLYAGPKKQCEEGGRWWAEQWRSCATPLDIQNLPRLVTDGADAGTPASGEAEGAPAA
jgi:hypothetical protein